jgi:hypothetical protein
MNTLVMLGVGWLLVLVVFLSFLALLRYLDHRERMAMILRGITPPDKRRPRLARPLLVRRPGVLHGGLITAMIGLALTIGLYPLGYILPPSLVAPYHLGPWLLAGLVPLAVGVALILGHYLTPGSPLNLPQQEQASETAGAAGSAARQAAPPALADDQNQPRPSGSMPVSLPELRRWTRPRRPPAGSAQPLPEEEQPEEEE